MSTKGYNLTVKQLTSAEKGKTATGKDKIKFRGETTIGKGDKARTITRTFVAQGAAAALLQGKLRKGQDVGLRVIFERAPANDDGSQGGEFCSIVGLPKAA